MEFLKEFLGDELYVQVEAKLKGNDKVKLANLATGEYVDKKKYDDKAAEVTTLNTQITNLTAEVKKFEGIDVEKLNQKIKDLETQSAADIKKFKTEAAAKEIVNGHKFTSKLAKDMVLNQLIAKGLQLDGDKLLGAEDFMTQMQKDNPDAFAKVEEGNDDNQPGAFVKTGADHQEKGGTDTLDLFGAVADFYK